MTNRLAGKTAIVTGAGAGIGKGCALMFARQGAHVIGIDISKDAMKNTARQAEDSGYRMTELSGFDLTHEDQVQSVVTAIGLQTANVDILLNAAAFGVFDWIEDLSFDDWNKTLAGELSIVFLLTKALWPMMKASANASIINFASVNAYHTLEGSAAIAHCAGKGGVLAMTRQLAMEGAPLGIRANTISPGFIEPEATSRHLQDVPELKDKVLSKNMIKRLGTPEDIAWLATYLASNEASYVTGSDFSVDAGATAW